MPLAVEQPKAASDGIHYADGLADRVGSIRFSRRLTRRAVDRVPAAIARDRGRLSDATAARARPGYTYFGVKFPTSLKLPVLTAVKIDDENSAPINRLADGDGVSTTSCMPPPTFSAKPG